MCLQWPPLDDDGNKDPTALEAVGVIVRRLDWKAATNLTGVLHTKFMTTDESSAYLGSANFDWRSLAQVKELGVVIRDCPSLTEDLQLVFEQYWYLAGANRTVPAAWPMAYWGDYDRTRPMLMGVGKTKVAAYLAVSPASLCPPTRT